MRNSHWLLLSLLISSCSVQQQALQPNIVNDSDIQIAPQWIESHLTPLHSLTGKVTRKSIPQLMLEDNIPGLSMAFVDQGKILWQRSYGYSDLENLTKVDKQTVFTGASLSKPLAAVAALNLVDNGMLNLDEDVNQTLKNWQIPESNFTTTEKVTLRRLISHRAGIRNDLWSSYLPNEEVPTLTQMLAGQSPSIDPATEVVRIPGSTERYSNPGYSIIQKLLEDVKNNSFENILDELVLQPSGMNDSSFEQPMPEQLKARRAIGYHEDLKPYPYRLFPYKAAGGIWTTPSDMAKFVITLFEDFEGKHNILSKQMTDKLFSRTPERLAFSKIFNDSSDDLLFRHYGSNQGFTSYLVGSIKKKQAVIIMINSDNGFELLDYTARAVAEYYHWDYLQPNQHDAAEVTNATITAYKNKYQNESQIFDFTVKDNALWVQNSPTSTPQKLIPIKNSGFISTADSTRYDFYLPRDGSSDVYQWVRIISPSGQNAWYEKVP